MGKKIFLQPLSRPFCVRERSQRGSCGRTPTVLPRAAAGATAPILAVPAVSASS
jgi:hypothetical protein